MVKLKRIYQPTTATPLKRHRKPEFASSAIILTLQFIWESGNLVVAEERDPALQSGLDALRFTLKETSHLVMTSRICTTEVSCRYEHCGGSETVIWIQFFSGVFASVAVHAEYAPIIIGDLKVTIRLLLPRVRVRRASGEGNESLAGVLKSLDLERSNKNLSTDKKDITINNNAAS